MRVRVCTKASKRHLRRSNSLGCKPQTETLNTTFRPTWQKLRSRTANSKRGMMLLLTFYCCRCSYVCCFHHSHHVVFFLGRILLCYFRIIQIFFYGNETINEWSGRDFQNSLEVWWGVIDRNGKELYILCTDSSVFSASSMQQHYKTAHKIIRKREFIPIALRTNLTYFLRAYSLSHFSFNVHSLPHQIAWLSDCRLVCRNVSNHPPREWSLNSRLIFRTVWTQTCISKKISCSGKPS